ncbi:MAG: hypothetical protein IT427_03695 [Pirellulales bacterium]|nr:hypothetical protein [Pirellulales bacterium]
MSRGVMQFQLEVPESLESQLFDFRRQVWKIKMFEAVGIAVFSVLVAFLAVFALDRLWNTPAMVRGMIFVASLAGCGVAPLYMHRWVWRHRHLEQLARLLSRKLPRIGDQLLGVIELAHNEVEQSRSHALCEAAIEQVAEDAQHRNFCDAAPDSRHRFWVTLAAAAFGVALCLTVVFPAAAQNAWARLLAPWTNTPRYTFAALVPLPNKIFIPHGEPFTVTANLKEGSPWKPAFGTARIAEQLPIESELNESSYRFKVPAQTTSGELELSIGDANQAVHIDPIYRPEPNSVVATIRLPEYLGRPEPQQYDVRAGSANPVKGSRASFMLTANRPLSSAKIDGAVAKIDGASFSTTEAVFAEPKQIEFQWEDEFSLSGKAPFQLTVTPVDDEAPSVACEDLPRKKVLLDSEQIAFKVKAHDDFGVKVVGIQWQGIGDELTEQPAKGERVLGPGGNDKTALELAGAFNAKSLGIEPQPIELRIFVEDFFPGRQRVYSAPCYFYILSPEQHAIWITEQMSKWHRQSLEVRDREMQLYETNKELRELTPSELAQPDHRKRIENQSAAERANGRRLSTLTTAGESLLKEAARNPEIGVGHLEKWAEMLKILKDISNHRMPSVADLLKDAAEQAKTAAAKSPSTSRPTAGKLRDLGKGGGRPTETKDDGLKKPSIPAVVDIETNQQPPDQSKGNEETQKKNASNPRLTLPQTNTFGGKPSDQPPPPPPDDKIEQAVKEQKDLLVEFEKVADELNNVLANLEGSTLMKRLKAASRVQYKVAGRIGDQIEPAFGVDASRAPTAPKEVFAKLGEEELKSSGDISYIMDDMQAYFERRHLVPFKSVLEEMRALDVLGSLRRLADDIPKEQGVSIAQAEFWSDTLDRWAEDLVDPACKGSCPGSKSKGSLPPSIVLEVLQILEAEVNLREETRIAEQAKAAQEAAAHEKEGRRLSKSQTGIEDRVTKVIERIGELPDAEADFGKEIQLLSMVESVMHEAAEILGQPETGQPAIAAETEAIELLLRSKRIRPGGGGGGSTPGGGGGGNTDDAAIALIGAGNNDKEVREDHGVSQATGISGPKLPEEFRAGLNEYFNQLETKPFLNR